MSKALEHFAGYLPCPSYALATVERNPFRVEALIFRLLEVLASFIVNLFIAVIDNMKSRSLFGPKTNSSTGHFLQNSATCSLNP